MVLNFYYLSDGEPEVTHYEFVASIGQKLEFYQTATAICFRKQPNNTDINVGVKGFGLMFACYLTGGWNDGTQLSVWFFASYFESFSPNTWHAGVTDYSSKNTGVLYVGNATDFDTTYNLSVFEAEDLNFPGLTENSMFRCYFNFHGDEADTRLDM